MGFFLLAGAIVLVPSILLVMTGHWLGIMLGIVWLCTWTWGFCSFSGGDC